MSAPLLELAGARVVRDGRTILDVERFRLDEGESLVVLGPNGAGKSTLVGLLTREVLPLWADPDPIRWRGDPRPELAQVHRILGVVSGSAQESARVHLSVRELVLGGRFGALGVPARLRAAVGPEDLRATDRALDELGITGLADRDVVTLSTGEARRALIARALVHDPAVLVLDEPCAGLDPTSAWHLRALMRELIVGGRTLVLVTHHIEDVVAPVSRAVLVSNGRIVADGPKREVLTGERLSALFGVPLEIEERDGEYRLW